MMISRFVRLIKNKDGATAIEYGLIAALITVSAVPTVSLIGKNLKAVFGSVGSSL
jgi:pilus assembly protein Flp/PilA